MEHRDCLSQEGKKLAPELDIGKNQQRNYESTTTIKRSLGFVERC